MTQVTKHRPATPKQAARRISPLDKVLDAELFKALSDFSVVSRHLSMLADAGVLESRKDGRTVFYQVQFARLCTALRSIADAFEQCCPTDSCCEGKC